MHSSLNVRRLHHASSNSQKTSNSPVTTPVQQHKLPNTQTQATLNLYNSLLDL